jgi:N-acetylmuramic acid 6-phosphate etherase
VNFRNDILVGMKRTDRFADLPTERAHPATKNLDQLTPLQLVTRMNREDARAVAAVRRVKKDVARGVALIADRLSKGGRILFIGAGTSGRLGVLEAAECPPTFHTPPGLVRAVMAGGRASVFRSREGAEDDGAAGRLTATRMSRPGDVVVGVAASGVTPFVRDALAEARRRGTATILVTCNPGVPTDAADVLIAAPTGPEVLTGSTRLKAGSATKMILNMLTTLAFVRRGKVFGHWMVDVQPRSAKLRARAARLVEELGEISPARAQRLLKNAGGRAKTAILMARRGLSADDADQLLRRADGFLRKALDLGDLARSSKSFKRENT